MGGETEAQRVEKICHSRSGIVAQDLKHSWVMILWLLLIIIIVNVPKAGVRVGLEEITKLSRVW